MDKMALLYTGVPTIPLMGCLIRGMYDYGCEYYRTFPQTPSVLDFAHYEREDPDKGFEEFLTIYDILNPNPSPITKRNKFGADCEDLGAAYAAWRTVIAKVNCRPVIAEYELPTIDPATGLPELKLHCFSRDVFPGWPAIGQDMAGFADIASKEFDPSLMLGMAPAPAGTKRIRQWLL